MHYKLIMKQYILIINPYIQEMFPEVGYLVLFWVVQRNYGSFIQEQIILCLGTKFYMKQ